MIAGLSCHKIMLLQVRRNSWDEVRELLTGNAASACAFIYLPHTRDCLEGQNLSLA